VVGQRRQIKKERERDEEKTEIMRFDLFE